MTYPTKSKARLMASASPRGPALLDELMTDVELAAELDVAPQTLATWRMNNTGPPVVYIGRKPHYSRDGVRAWLEAGGSK
jgi:hypothetical protein